MTVCLGIPGRVVELLPGFEGQVALVEVSGAPRRVNVGLLEEPPERGQWVLIHVGFAVAAVDEAEATRALEGLQLLGRPGEEAPP